MPFSQCSAVCDISDDWRQATASLSDNLCSVPSSVLLSVIRVFIIQSTQQPKETVLSEVLVAYLPLFHHVSRILHLILIKMVNIFRSSSYLSVIVIGNLYHDVCVSY